MFILYYLSSCNISCSYRNKGCLAIGLATRSHNDPTNVKIDRIAENSINCGKLDPIIRQLLSN